MTDPCLKDHKPGRWTDIDLSKILMTIVVLLLLCSMVAGFGFELGRTVALYMNAIFHIGAPCLTG